ncbi:unnamed protein product, partial [Mesorhabditis spiculigera]
MDALIQMLPPFLRKISTHHDFPGQRLAERVFQVIVVISGIIGFIVGYYTQQLSHSVYIVFIGSAIASLVVLPPWPCFRKQPLPWQKPIDHTKEETKKDK